MYSHFKGRKTLIAVTAYPCFTIVVEYPKNIFKIMPNSGIIKRPIIAGQ